MDIKEAFHSLDHNFLVSTLEKYGFDENFIAKVIVLLRNQGSRVLNGGTITKYFLLRRGALQDDLHPTFLINWTLKILFHLLKSKSELKGLAIFGHCYIHSVYADDDFSYRTLFLENI